MNGLPRYTNKIRLPIFLLVLLLFLIAYPYLHHTYPKHIAIVELFFALIMISGVSLLTRHKKTLYFMVGLAATILIGIFIMGTVQSRVLLFFVLLVELLFFLVILISLVTYIYKQKEVTLDKLYAAITSYLVLGIVFAVLYALVATVTPVAFQYTVSTDFASLSLFPHPAFFSEALYFSFVTLATLGYGDWVALMGPLKMVASLEAISGQLFIAILIARLVGIQIAQSIADDD